MSRPRKNPVNALTGAVDALSIANPRGRARAPPEPINEQAVYNEAKRVIEQWNQGKFADDVARNNRFNAVINPQTGGEVSSKMLLKIAVELCTDLGGLTADEVRPSKTMAQTPRAQNIFLKRLERRTNPTVIAVNYNDLAWMGECIRRYDLNLKKFNAAVLKRAGDETYEYIKDLTGRARSSRPNRRSGLPPPYPSRSRSALPYPEVEDLAASKVSSQYRSDPSRVPLPLPRVDMPSYVAATAGKANGRTRKTKDDDDSDCDSGSDSASCSSDSDKDCSNKDCSDQDQDEDEKKDESDDEDDDRAKNHASESEASSSSGSDSD